MLEYKFKPPKKSSTDEAHSLHGNLGKMRFKAVKHQKYVLTFEQHLSHDQGVILD